MPIMPIMTPRCAVLLLLLVAISTDAEAHRGATSSYTPKPTAAVRLRARLAKLKQLGKEPREKTVKQEPAEVQSNGGVSTQAVCGPDTSVPSSLGNVCKLHMVFLSGLYVCSGWVIGPKRIATAGHCVIDETGYAHAITVNCDGVEMVSESYTVHEQFYKWTYTQRNVGVHNLDAAVITLPRALPSSVTPWRVDDASCPDVPLGGVIQ